MSLMVADRFKSPGDVIVLSVHWGGNWEYQVDKRHRKFAHAAIKNAGVDIIHGHSSHHARGECCLYNFTILVNSDVHLQSLINTLLWLVITSLHFDLL